MLRKLQVIFGILIGVAMVVFITAMLVNVNVSPMPGWHAPVVWSCFGLIAFSCLLIVVTLALDLREPKEEDEEEPDAEDAIPDELAAVGAGSQIIAGEGIADAADTAPEPGESGIGQFDAEHEAAPATSGLGMLSTEEVFESPAGGSGASGTIDFGDAPTEQFEFKDLTDEE